MTPPRSVEAWAACGEHGGCDVFSPDCPYCRDNRRNFIDYAAEQVAQARGEEREACAKVASAHGTLGRWEMVVTTGNKIAAAIRERK